MRWQCFLWDSKCFDFLKTLDLFRIAFPSNSIYLYFFDDNKIIDKLPMVNSPRLILSYHLIKRERMLSDDTRSATNVLTMSVHHNVACRDFRETWPKMIVLIKASWFSDNTTARNTSRCVGRTDRYVIWTPPALTFWRAM